MKNVLKLAFATMAVAFAGYSVYTNQEKTVLSDLALNNVEALAWPPE